MSGAKLKLSSKVTLSAGKTCDTSPLSSASCSCCTDDCSADDSSSLGYGSGLSSTYSDVVEARIDDFYRNSNSATPTSARRLGPFGEAEFYDLDSVDSFSLGSYSYDDNVESDLATDCDFRIGSNNFALPSLSEGVKGSFTDFDLVEPSELLRRSISTKLQISEAPSPKSYCARVRVRASREKNFQGDTSFPKPASSALRGIPEEEHIYEEVHYDTTDLNLEGLRPPPLPKRTYCRSKSKPGASRNRSRSVPVSGSSTYKVRNQGIRKSKN